MAVNVKETKSESYKKMEELKQRAIDAPIDEVMIRLGFQLTISGQYARMNGCPMKGHDHAGPGTTKLNLDYNRGYCNNCVDGARSFNNIDAVMDTLGCSFKAAVEFILGVNVATFDVTTASPRKVRKAPEAPKPRTEEEIILIHRVYQCFVNSCIPLSDEHFIHLSEERKLSYDKLGDFFEMPTKAEYEEVHTAFMLALVEEDIEIEEVLGVVPGFFQDEDGQLAFSPIGGIGILCWDMCGFIRGFLIRADDPKAVPRYKMFSSSWAKNQKGASCGVFPDTVLTEGDKTKYLAITEGHFKALKLAKYGYTTLSLNGVNSTGQGVLAEFMELAKSTGLDTHLFFDADMADNKGVYSAGKNIWKEFQKQGLPLYVVTWAIEYGKGVDDVLISGNGKKMKRILPENYFVR